MASLYEYGLDRLLPLVLLLCLLLSLFSASARAADPSENQWLIAPYLWAPDIKGSVAFGGTTVPLDVTARELAGGVNAGALGYAQWHHDRHFLYLEALGFSFKDKQFEPVSGLNIKASLLFLETGYGQNLSFDVPLPTDGVLSVSPYAGLRYARLDATAATPEGSLIQASMTTRNHWVDPSAGVIIEAPLSGHLALTMKLDASGFNIDHDRYWSAIGVLRWYFTADLSIGAGYRITDFEADPRDSDDVKLRLRGKGPEAGLTYSF